MRITYKNQTDAVRNAAFYITQGFYARVVRVNSSWFIYIDGAING